MAILKKFLASAATTINNNNNRKNKKNKKVPKSVSFVNDDETSLIIIEMNDNNSDSMRRDHHSGRTSMIIIEVEKFHPNTKSDIWFTKSEELEFKQRDQRLCMSLQTLSPQALEQQTGDSPRGLEHGICYETLNSINNRRRRSLNCVFASQTLFKKQGRDGSESIAKSYGLVCEDAIKTAIERAKHDEDFVDTNIHKLGSSRSLLMSTSSTSSSSSSKENSTTPSPASNNKKKCNPIKKMFNGGNKKCPS